MLAPDHRSAEYRQLAGQRHALQLKIIGEDHVAADIGQHGERAGGDDGAADREAIETVGQIHGVARARRSRESMKSRNGRKLR